MYYEQYPIYRCRVIFMEDYIPIKPDRSQLFDRQTSKWLFGRQTSEWS